MVVRDLIPEVRRLMSEGKGDRVIAETLGITRHQARNTMREIELADAKQGASIAPAESFAETLRHDPEAWAIRINARWRQSRENIIETGRLLLDAKEACPHGSFESEVVTRLHFTPNVAQRLMAIARDPRLSNPAHVQLLPPSWGTLYELTKLSDEEFDRGVHEQIIRPDMERKEVEILRPTPHRVRTEIGSDGGGEATITEIERPAGTGDPLAEPLAAVTPAETDPETGGRVRKEAGVATGPSETTQMPGGGLAVTHNRVEPADSLDYFPTPPWATRAFMERVLVHLRRIAPVRFQTAKDPACGEGHMAEVLKEYFRKVISTDIKDYGYGDAVADFLDPADNPDYDADWIITNPPFGDNTDKFILKALQQASYGVAMLVRLQCLETVGRYERIYRDMPPSLIAFFVERVPMHKERWEPEGDTMTAYIWLVWIKGMSPQPPFWIPPGCRDALTRPDDAERFTQKPVARREHVWPAEPDPLPPSEPQQPDTDELDIPEFLRRQSA